MTLPQARALLPNLLARNRDRESERAAQEALLEVADAFSPRVENAGDGLVYLDLDGHAALRASALSASGDRVICDRVIDQSPDRRSQIADRRLVLEAELALSRQILSTVEKAALPARLGLASSKLAARVAASLPDSPHVVPAGEEAAFLAPLSLERLAPEIGIAATLDRWGIRSIGELAKLPEGEVGSRLGELGRALHATARGVDPCPLAPHVPPPRPDGGHGARVAAGDSRALPLPRPRGARPARRAPGGAGARLLCVWMCR